jgi:hypothetical protein
MVPKGVWGTQLKGCLPNLALTAGSLVARIEAESRAS